MPSYSVREETPTVMIISVSFFRVTE